VKPFSERNPVLIAINGLTLIVVLMAVAMNFNRLPLVSGTTYKAQFSDASGLVKGEEVRVAGIKVGAVTDISLDESLVEVEFTVKDVDLGRDTTAAIEVKTLLGQHYLSVTPAGSGRLKENAVIPIERTSTPLNIVPAFLRLTEQTQAIDTDQVAQAFDALSSVLRTTAPELRGTLRGLSRLSHAVTIRDDEIRELFSHAKHVTGVVADRDQDIAQLVRASNSVLEVLSSRRDTIARIIKGTSELAVQLRGLVADNARELKPALTKLNSVLEVLQKNKSQLDSILKWGAVYAREFTNVGGSGHWFDASIKIPRGFAACTNDNLALGGFLAPILSQLNQTVNGSSAPCLPFGPATGGQ
jgi:phospholipid/cholesterol/gamma-HCH transport system substrate-binding protein